MVAGDLVSGTTQTGSRYSLPIFPLPKVVFFPRTLLPLHIFEDRYRKLMGAALKGLRQIGIVLLKPGWEKDYYGTPPIHPVGTAGEIRTWDRLPDGRYNLILSGLHRIRILRQAQMSPFRIAEVEVVPEEPADEGAETVRAQKERLIELFRTYAQEVAQVEWQEELFTPRLALESLVNSVASSLPVGEEVRQQLLELSDLEERVRRVEGHLERQITYGRALGQYKHLIPDDPKLN